MRKFCTSSKVYSCRSAWETELWFIIHYCHSLLLDILHSSTSCSLFIIHTGASVHFNALPISSICWLFVWNKKVEPFCEEERHWLSGCFLQLFQFRQILPELRDNCVGGGLWLQSVLCFTSSSPAQAESVAAASSQCQNILKSVSSFLSSVLNCKTLAILLSLVLRLCFSFCNPLRSGYHSGYLVMAGKRN